MRAIARHVEHGSKIPTLLSTMHLYRSTARRGALAERYAYSFREALFAEVIVGVDPIPQMPGNHDVGAKTIGMPCTLRGGAPTLTS